MSKSKLLIHEHKKAVSYTHEQRGVFTD